MPPAPAWLKAWRRLVCSAIEIFLAPLVAMRAALTRMTKSKRSLRFMINNDEWKPVISMLQKANEILKPPTGEPPTCEKHAQAMVHKMIHQKGAMQSLWACPCSGCTSTTTKTKEEQYQSKNDIRDACDHTKGGKPAVKEYTAGKWGTFATCEVCNRRWRKVGTEWQVDDKDKAAASQRSLSLSQLSSLPRTNTEARQSPAQASNDTWTPSSACGARPKPKPRGRVRRQPPPQAEDPMDTGEVHTVETDDEATWGVEEDDLETVQSFHIGTEEDEDYEWSE